MQVGSLHWTVKSHMDAWPLRQADNDVQFSLESWPRPRKVTILCTDSHLLHGGEQGGLVTRAGYPAVVHMSVVLQ